MAQKSEFFTSRWALILAALGMAIGTGNIWRFPRIIAKAGGGAFLIPWLLFLFLWSIPLLIVEFAIGRSTRRGCLGAVGKLVGEKSAWMGGFVALCSAAIMFYYSVVAGWCFKYSIAAVTGELSGIVDGKGGLAYFSAFSSGLEPVFFHAAAIGICSLIVWRGIAGGIERANKIIIPSLFVILIISLWRSLTLPGAVQGLAFLFTPRWETLADYRTWLEALTQSAWSTGAGWGLILTYAVYMRRRQGVVLNSLLTGLGNNSASLLAAMVIIPTAFALIPVAMPGADPEVVIQESGPASTGLAFVYIPALFNQIQAEFGQFFMVIFFVALSMAAISSLIAMVELVTRILVDAGMRRSRAIPIVCVAGFALGVPSAVSMDFFENQDWVWGVGLMVSGFFLTVTAIRFGIDRFRTRLINTTTKDKVGRWFNAVVAIILPIEFFALVFWWFAQAAGAGWWELFSRYWWKVEVWWDAFFNTWLNPISKFNPATCLFQWGIAIILLLLIGRPLARRSLRPQVQLDTVED